jgi:hypothetical protein
MLRFAPFSRSFDRRMIRTISFAALALAAACLPAAAQSAADVNATIEALFGESAPFERAFDAIQRAVAAHDAAGLAEWVAYPFRVSYDDEELIVETPSQFVADYDDIVTEDIADAVAAQDYASLFVNTDGVMFGNGEMWMTLVCDDDACTRNSVKVIASQSTQ